jgi:hypothetical protein
MRIKTYKRETAWISLLFLFYLCLFGRVEVVEILTWPVFLFVGAAFGMDWVAKFTSLGGRNATLDPNTKK